MRILEQTRTEAIRADAEVGVEVGYARFSTSTPGRYGIAIVAYNYPLFAPSVATVTLEVAPPPHP